MAQENFVQVYKVAVILIFTDLYLDKNGRDALHFGVSGVIIK